MELVPPEPWELDRQAISRDHGLEAHWELSTDYQSHVARFDEVLAHHRAIPTHLLDAGHFLLETHSPEFLAVVRPFVARLAEESSS